MKKLVLAAIISLTTAASANSLNVSIAEERGDENSFTVSFSTKAVMSSMCYMKINKLELTAPMSAGSGETTNGKITANASTDIMSRCMMAFGPHRGAIELTKGRGLPRIVNGSYELIINYENYGILVISEDDVKLDTPEETEETVFEGSLQTGIITIGGETTGTIITSADGTYELLLNEDIRNEINFQDFHGQMATVTGKLRRFQGVEITVRRIIEVSAIELL